MNKYDETDIKSILKYAKRLMGHTLREMCDEYIINNPYSGKGKFGQLLEKYYFGYNVNSNSEADFKTAGLELKATPLKLLKKNEKLSAKERLVLNIINYNEVVKQDFLNSDFWTKNSKLLLIFYFYQQEKDLLDYLIKYVEIWEYPEVDLEVIRQDWNKINEKILAGKAHELSEGDTIYLGACTKSADSSSTRKQPFNSILAKQRAYSLKQGYVNHIISTISNESEVISVNFINDPEEIKVKSFEEVLYEKFNPFIGKTTDEIYSELNLNINKKAKNFQASLTKAILGISDKFEIQEFIKANIKVKTVRIKSNDLPKESMSFPSFKYLEIVDQDWDDSQIKEILESKFLFVFFRICEGKLILEKVKLWNMPYNDLMEVEKVWLKTKYIVGNGIIVKEIKGNGTRRTNFPGMKNSSIAHVRPHATNAKDTYPLPVLDILTNKLEYTKHSFWLNDSYVRDEIFLK